MIQPQKQKSWTSNPSHCSWIETSPSQNTSWHAAPPVDCQPLGSTEKGPPERDQHRVKNNWLLPSLPGGQSQHLLPLQTKNHYKILFSPFKPLVWIVAPRLALQIIQIMSCRLMDNVFPSANLMLQPLKTKTMCFFVSNVKISHGDAKHKTVTYWSIGATSHQMSCFQQSASYVAD